MLLAIAVKIQGSDEKLPVAFHSLLQALGGHSKLVWIWEVYFQETRKENGSGMGRVKRWTKGNVLLKRRGESPGIPRAVWETSTYTKAWKHWFFGETVGKGFPLSAENTSSEDHPAIAQLIHVLSLCSVPTNSPWEDTLPPNIPGF